MARKLLLGLGALVASLAMAVVALHLLVDANAFKPQIEQVVAGRFNRTLRIDGDLRLAVFPRIAIELPKTKLSEHESERTFATLDSARIGVALLPLLAGWFEAGRIEITGLTATIERRADRSTSIDDLIERTMQTPPSSPAEEKPAEDAPGFRVAGIELIDAQLTLVDSGQTVLTMSKLSLTTGALAAKASAPVSLAGAFNAPMAKAQGALSLSGALAIDLAANAFNVQSLEARLTGAVDGGRVDLQIRAAQFSYGETIAADGVIFELWPTGKHELRVTGAIDGIAGTPQLLTAKTLRAEVEIEQRARKFVGQFASTAQTSLEEQTMQLPELSGEVTINDRALPEKSLKLPFSGHISLNARQQTLALAVESKLDGSAFKAAIHVAGFAAPTFHVDVDAEWLDVDRYLPRTANGNSQSATRASVEEEGIDLSLLLGLRLAGRARVGRLHAAGIQASDVQLTANAEGGRLDVTPLSARLYGGTLAGSAFADANGNRMGLHATMDDVAIEPLLRDALKQDLLAGTGKLRVDITTEGKTVAAARQALNGAAGLQLRDGAIKGFDLVRQLRDARDLIRGRRSDSYRADAAQKTEFSELAASFTITNGVARNDDLEAKSSLLRLAGSGNIDIGAGRIDYTARVSATDAVRGPDGREIEELRGVTIPVRLTGPFEQMSYEIDWAGVAQEGLKARATEEVKKRLGTEAVEQRKQLEERARELLKGMFNR